MQLRLANPDQADALQQGLSHWLPTYQVVTKRAGAPSRRSTAPAARFHLDVNQPPARPVLVVEADPVKAKNAGLKVMRKALAAADMQVTPRATSNTTPLKTSILKDQAQR